VVPAAERLLRDHLERGVLTMRGAERSRAVALTLADLRGEEPPMGQDLLEEALLLRGGDRAAAVRR
jgi:predicted ATPase with chaperone activity